MALATGTHLRASTTRCEVVVVRAPDEDGAVRCGGALMTSDAHPAHADEPADGPTVSLGKRYTHEPSGLELLCVKPGAGPLEFEGQELTLKSAKPLPASD
jgi:hypothetical protein